VGAVTRSMLVYDIISPVTLVGVILGGATVFLFSGLLIDAVTRAMGTLCQNNILGIVVNGAARRFYDEGQDTWDATFEMIAYAVWKDQDQSAFFITDQTAAVDPAIMAMCATESQVGMELYTRASPS